MTRRAVLAACAVGRSPCRGIPRRPKTTCGEEFLSPPDSAKAWCYWWWLNGAASKEGITRDFEEMKQAGDQRGAALRCRRGGTGGAARTAVHERRVARALQARRARGGPLRHRAGREPVQRLECGGPWVTPEHAAKKLVSAQTVVKGPGRATVALPQPPAVQGFYRDIVVLAAPMPDDALAGVQVGRQFAVSGLRPGAGRRRRRRDPCQTLPHPVLASAQPYVDRSELERTGDRDCLVVRSPGS